MSAWRFIDTGFRDGASNMAVDESLLRGVIAGTTPPTVRVFGWRPPTVSTGYSQDLRRELDLEACGRAGVGVVRRPTGGRAVLHAGELTYSVVGMAGAEPLGETIMETYLAISRALLAGLAVLGVRADLEQVASPVRVRGKDASPPCFASSGRFEIVTDGKKLVGSAQRRLGGAILQHGSLLIDGTHARIADLLRVPEPRRAAIRRSLEEKTTCLEELMRRRPEFGEVARAVARGFERAWGVNLEPACLTASEAEDASVLATEYTT